MKKVTTCSFSIVIVLLVLINFPLQAKSLQHETGHNSSVEHKSIEALDVSLADNNTKDILKQNWLKEYKKAEHKKKHFPISKTFCSVISSIIIFSLIISFLYFSGIFNRLNIKKRLYLSHGSLAVLAIILGFTTYTYIAKINNAGTLESAFLEVEMMVAEMTTAQNEFLLHGIENKEYGEIEIQKVEHLLKEFSTDIELIENNPELPIQFTEKIASFQKLVKDYGHAFHELTKAYHKIENNKEHLDKIAYSMEESLEEMMHHHEKELSDLEAEGTNIKEITYQTIVIEHLMEAEIALLKAAHAEVEFILDKHEERVSYAEKELGLSLGYLHTLENELREDSEKIKLAKVIDNTKLYIKEFKEIVESEALILKDLAIMKEKSFHAEENAAELSFDAKTLAEAYTKEGDLIAVILIIIAVVIGITLSLTISKAIANPINNIIGGLDAGSHQVSSAAGQVANSSQGMAQGASELASNLEEISSSLEEMSSMTQQNADNTNQANQLATTTKEKADRGNKAMEKMSAVISEVKKSSDETAKIIKTIDEIAFQTNLLALNAAVEAARAGEAGKGFAVVAEEVRNLAMRSAEAAKSTSELIERSQKNTDNGVTATSDVGNILKEISSETNNLTELIHEISEASKEHSQGIEQINTAVASMDQITQTNASSSEESAAAAEELTGQSTDLRNMLGVLVKVVEGSSNNESAPSPQPVKMEINTPQQRHHAVTSAKINSSSSPKHNISLQAKPKTAQQISPDQVIPLDDDEF